MDFKKNIRVQSHVLEKVIVVFMILFAIAAVYILINAMSGSAKPDPTIAVVEILLILILAIFAQTYVLIKIYERQTDQPK